MTVIISGTDGVSDVDGTAGTPALRGTDANTGIFFGADQVGVATNGVERVEFGNSETVFNDGGADVDFRVEGDTDANLLFVDASTDRVGIGTNAPSQKFTVNGIIASVRSGSTAALVNLSNDNNSWNLTTGTSTAQFRIDNNLLGTAVAIDSSNNFLVGKTIANQIGDVGFEANSGGVGFFTAAGQTCINVNRKTDDGVLIQFWQDTVPEGSISVSGSTVSYNAFTGGHWSQLQEGRGYNPDIPRGTVMSTIGEMCEWKSVEWTETTEHPAMPAVEAKEVVLDEEGDVIEPAVEAVEGKDAWTETSEKREAYLGQLPMGATFEEDGFTKTVIDDGNERLPKVKISDVVGDKAVYGVFQTWDEVEDMLVTSLGAFVVRIATGVTVEIGDLLESNGDGCAKVQDDDVIRSKTIAKVTSTNPTATYDDGSYTVPAVIYCG